MDPVQRLLIAKAIEERLLDYWREVDENGGRQAGAFWTEDAVWEAPARAFKGRAEIQSFFDWRLTRGDRLAFHMVANLKTVVESETRASSTWYLVLYAADGKPVLPTHPPIQIAYMTDRCVRDREGGWLLAHRKFENWFEGGTPTTNPNLDDK